MSKRLNVEHAFDPEARQAQADFDAYLKTRPTINSKGLRNPDGNYIDADAEAYFDNLRSAHYSESQIPYEEMSQLELARVVVDAQQQGDRTTEMNANEILLEKIFEHAQRMTSKGLEENQTSEDIALERVIRYMDGYRNQTSPGSTDDVNVEEVYTNGDIEEQTSDHDFTQELAIEETGIDGSETQHTDVQRPDEIFEEGNAIEENGVEEEITDEEQERDDLWEHLRNRNWSNNHNGGNEDRLGINDNGVGSDLGGIFNRSVRRAQVAVGNVVTGNVRRRNVIIGAVVGFVTAWGIQKLTGDHESVKHVVHSGITPDNTLAAHDGQSFPEVLRTNGYRHPHQVISNLNDSGVLHGDGPLANRLVESHDGNLHGLTVENFVDERGAKGTMWTGDDLAPVLPERTVIEVNPGIGPVEAGAIGAVVGGVGAGLATSDFENNAEEIPLENNQTRADDNPTTQEREGPVTQDENYGNDEEVITLQRQAAEIGAYRAYIEDLLQQNRELLQLNRELIARLHSYEIDDDDDEENA